MKQGSGLGSHLREPPLSLPAPGAARDTGVRLENARGVRLEPGSGLERGRLGNGTTLRGHPGACRSDPLRSGAAPGTGSGSPLSQHPGRMQVRGRGGGASAEPREAAAELPRFRPGRPPACAPLRWPVRPGALLRRRPELAGRATAAPSELPGPKSVRLAAPRSPAGEAGGGGEAAQAGEQSWAAFDVGAAHPGELSARPAAPRGGAPGPRILIVPARARARPRPPAPSPPARRKRPGGRRQGWEAAMRTAGETRRRRHEPAGAQTERP